MKFSTSSMALLLLSNSPALAHPQPVTDIQSLETREQAERNNGRFDDVKDLWKRKGGGGGGGAGKGSSTSSKTGSSSRATKTASRVGSTER